MASPWYRDGLEFECSQCGHCCTGDPGYVWVTLSEIERLAEFLRLSREEFSKLYVRRVGTRYSLVEKRNGDCTFYEDGCTVYPARPKQCRTFPFWPENLASRTRWKEAAEGCPGIGEGRLYSVEEIRLLRRGESRTSSSR